MNQTRFSKYSAMEQRIQNGLIDRDDAELVSSLYEIAKTAADYKLMLDFHGMYKPTGLQEHFQTS